MARFETSKLPFGPPLEPMLAKRVDALPEGEGWLYEPKWDGFRALVFRDGDSLYTQSRDSRPLDRYFPELREPLLAQLPEACVLDGEIVVARNGSLDFEALQLRLHPAASRVNKLAGEIPASFVAFDLLALGGLDLRERPQTERRAELQRVLASAKPPLHITPATTDRALASEWFERFEGAGLDGVMAKPFGLTYQPKKRVMLKVKHARTVDCVVAGFRWYKNGPGELVGSLLLGLHDDRGRLQHVGVTSSFTMAKRRALAQELEPLRANALAGHPWAEWAEHEASERKPGMQSRWSAGKDLTWEPLRLERVCEVTFDHLEGGRFRHTATFLRWRPDKPPRECGFDQIDVTPPYELASSGREAHDLRPRRARRYRALGMAKKQRVTLDVGGREVSISSPDKLYFPKAGLTKLDLVQYYLAVADGALRGAGDRPNVLKRYVDGAEGEFFFQKRAPDKRPEWLDTVTLRFPSGRQAEEIVPREPAALAWMANLGCIDLNPHPVRASDLDHPDELRIDLDPVPGVEWPQIVEVAKVVREVLYDYRLVGWPKTSGSRGVHVNVRLLPRWGFDEVRRSALAVAREVERRAPTIATSKWWKEERHGVFLDYNQNAKDRTVASAYSVRPTPDARVSAPVTWEELFECSPGDFTMKTVPARFAELGDPHSGIDDTPCSLDAILALSAEQEAHGLGDAPWPPHYAKQEGEPARVQPSRAKKAGAKKAGTKTERRREKHPLIEIARAAKKDDALAGLERWKARHPEAAGHLDVTDVLVDAMRGRYTTWTRIRVNLRNVPEELRPPQEPLDPDYDPWKDG